MCGFVIHPAVGPKTFKEMIDYAKANPGKLSYGSAGLGTSTHLRIEMLKYRAGIDILHVPYRGSADALNDLLPNTVQMMNEINVLPHVKAGKLILLDINYTRAPSGFPGRADADRARLPQLRRADLVLRPGARRHRPRTSSPQLNAKIVEIAKSEEMIARMRAINVVVPIQTPEEMTKHLIEDTGRNAEVDQGRQHQAGVGLRRRTAVAVAGTVVPVATGIRGFRLRRRLRDLAADRCASDGGPDAEGMQQSAPADDPARGDVCIPQGIGLVFHETKLLPKR